MANLVSAIKVLWVWVMKMAGVSPHTVEIYPGTTINFWVPNETLNKPKNYKTTTITSPNPNKPVVVLIHGFVADGITTWPFQVSSLTKHYSVYVPDLLFFGGSISDNPDKSPAFQAECLMKGLRKFGVEKCTVVGFSYGGMVAFKMAEMYPNLVRSLVVTGAVMAVTESINDVVLGSLGFSSFSEMLLPTSVEGLKELFSLGAHMNLWFPRRLLKDFLEVMFDNRKERGDLLEALIVSNKDATIIPNSPQRFLLLWGENDQIFNVEFAQNIKQQLGDKATFRGIKEAGHLVHLERPFAYNKCLKQFLHSLQADEA